MFQKRATKSKKANNNSIDSYFVDVVYNKSNSRGHDFLQISNLKKSSASVKESDLGDDGRLRGK